MQFMSNQLSISIQWYKYPYPISNIKYLDFKWNLYVCYLNTFLYIIKKILKPTLNETYIQTNVSWDNKKKIHWCNCLVDALNNILFAIISLFAIICPTKILLDCGRPVV